MPEMRFHPFASALSFLVGTLLVVACASIETRDEAGESNRGDLRRGTAEPRRTDGPYPPDPLKLDEGPTHEFELQPLPEGPRRGRMRPEAPETRFREIDRGRGEGERLFADPRADQLEFRQYTELSGVVGLTNTCCPEPSVTDRGQTVLMTGNRWVAFSTDEGSTFTSSDPSTIFPTADGGFCCDQVLLYDPRHDLFVWLYQTWQDPNSGANRVRLAVATNAELINSNATAWTYWDFTTAAIGGGGQWLDFLDLAGGNNHVYFSVNSVGGGGRVFVRIPTAQLAARGTITYSYTAPISGVGFARFTQNTGDEVFWGSTVDSSTIVVYSMKEGSNSYSWRNIAINSWPRARPSSLCPNNEDWLENFAQGYAFYGAARHNDSVWFAWRAGAGGGFPRPHVQMVNIDVSNYQVLQQTQIWNQDFAFSHPNLAFNVLGELGMSVSFGGNNLNGSHGVHILGVPNVVVPRLSDTCTDRWGDYNTVRRSGLNSAEWVAVGYTNDLDNGVLRATPHFIRFARSAG